MRIDVAAIDVELVLIRVHNIRIVRDDVLRDDDQRIARQRIVIVKQADVISLGQAQGGIGSAGNADILAQPLNLDPAIADTRDFIQRLAGFLQSRRVVGDAQFPMWIKLFAY